MSRYDLLPPNATQLERDFSRATSPLERLAYTSTQVFSPDVFEPDVFDDKQPVPNIRTAKRIDIPDSVLPWLIYEYGLGEILPYLGDNQRRAIADGVLWQRIRGTPEAVRIALTWINLTGVIEESEGGSARWAEYQLGLSAPTSGDQIIDDIVGVTRISSPVRSRLQRIYAGYDFRRFVLDDSKLSDGGILSDHSGVRPQPDWPQISYGQVLGSYVGQLAALSLEDRQLLLQESDAEILLDGFTTVESVCTSQIAVHVTDPDLFLLDHSLIDEEWHKLNYPSLLTTLEGVGANYAGQTWSSFGWLEGETWASANVVISSSMQTTS